MDHNTYEEFVSNPLWDKIKTTFIEKKEVLLQQILDPAVEDITAQRIEYKLIDEFLNMPKDIYEGEEA